MPRYGALLRRLLDALRSRVGARTRLERQETAKETVAEMVFRRGREVEVHLVELELPGVNWDSMSEAYVDAEWGRTLAGLPTRLGPGDAVVLVPDQHPSRACGTGAPPVVVREPPAVMIGWLLGPTVHPDRLVLGPWTG